MRGGGKGAERARAERNLSFHRGRRFASFHALMLKTIARPLAILALLSAASLGDVVVLKNGEKVEGRVLKETAAAVTVEVKMAGGITDERVIKMTEVEKIEKVSPDAEAWVALKGMTTGEDSIEPEGYQQAAAVLGNFIAQFPESANVAEARKKLAVFEEEKKRVDAGEMKVGGKWLTKEQVQEDRVQIEGRRKLALMTRQAAAGQLVEAMITFAGFEKAADGSASYPEAVVLARKVLPLLRTAAEARRAQIKAQMEEGRRRLNNVQGAERAQLETLQKQQAAQTEAAVTALERSGVRWLPLNPSNEKSINALLSKVSTELSSVTRHDVEKMRASIAAAGRAKAALAANDVATAEKALTEAGGAWSQNEIVKRLQPKLAEARTKAAEDAAKAAIAASAAPPPPPVVKPTPPPVPVAPEPVVEEPPKEDDGSLFTKPAFWVILIIVLGFTALVMKFLRKLKDPTKNILDQ
jgi:hypothetical protein